MKSPYGSGSSGNAHNWVGARRWTTLKLPGDGGPHMQGGAELKFTNREGSDELELFK